MEDEKNAEWHSCLTGVPPQRLGPFACAASDPRPLRSLTAWSNSHRHSAPLITTDRHSSPSSPWFAQVHWLLRKAAEQKSTPFTHPPPGRAADPVTDYEARAKNADASMRTLYPIYIMAACGIAAVPIIRSFFIYFDVGDIE